MPPATLSHPQTIFVTNLFDMPHYVRELAPVRVISIIQPEFQPDRPASLAATHHLRLGVHDISERLPDQILADHADIERLIAFLQDWDPGEGALLTHCYAGVSRSTATALIAATIKTGDPVGSARRLRTAAPHAQPNRRIVVLADEILGLAGALIAARDAMGAHQNVAEGPLTVLRLVDALSSTGSRNPPDDGST
ncbi:MAG: hypothetical protein PVF57_00200 [Pseudomonadales bacterium]